MTLDLDSVRAFAAEARTFCEFVETASTVPLDHRLHEGRQRLAALVAAACRLPEGKPDSGEVDAVERLAPYWPGFEHMDGYWEIFDPYELDEPVASSLSDDFLDIYGDLQAGFAVLGQEGADAAIWHWRFHFDTHWGNHAVGALHALHRACARERNPQSGR